MYFLNKILFCLFSLYSVSTLAESNTSTNTELQLVGIWELESFRCEDGSDIPSDQPQNPFDIATIKPTKTFKPKNQFEDKVVIPFGRDITCETVGMGQYNLVSGFLKIILEKLSSPDCPSLVQGFNSNLEDNNTLMYEFKMLTPKQFLLLQPLENGETDFRCGKDLRVAEYWKKI